MSSRPVLECSKLGSSPTLAFRAAARVTTEGHTREASGPLPDTFDLVTLTGLMRWLSWCRSLLPCCVVAARIGVPMGRLGPTLLCKVWVQDYFRSWTNLSQTWQGGIVCQIMAELGPFCQMGPCQITDPRPAPSTRRP